MLPTVFLEVSADIPLIGALPRILGLAYADGYEAIFPEDNTGDPDIVPEDFVARAPALEVFERCGETEFDRATEFLWSRGISVSRFHLIQERGEAEPGWNRDFSDQSVSMVEINQVLRSPQFVGYRVMKFRPVELGSDQEPKFISDSK